MSVIAKTPQKKPTIRRSGKLPGFKTVFEICCEPDSTLGQTAEEYDGVSVFRVTKSEDFSNTSTVEDLIAKVSGEAIGAHVHGSLDCSPWSIRQYMNARKLGEGFQKKLKKRRRLSK